MVDGRAGQRTELTVAIESAGGFGRVMKSSQHTGVCLARRTILAIGVCLAGLALAATCTPGNKGPAMTDEERRGRIEGMYAKYKQDFPNVPEAAVDDLVKLQAKDAVVVVDVRAPAEMAVSRIPGAITLAEFRQDPERHREKKIIAYCTIGVRSAKSTTELGGQGFDAYNLKGGILLWTHAGRPLADTDGNETRRVHVYGRKWALSAEGYEDEF